jgi:hypothetical protein
VDGAKRESIKAVAVLVLCVSAVVAAVMWFDDQPTRTTWILRIALTLVAVASLAIFLKVSYWAKRDLAPDFLGRECRSFLECRGYDGFVRDLRRDCSCCSSTGLAERLAPGPTAWACRFGRPGT